MVQPAARAGASLVAVSDCGTFHGTIAATTPTGLRRTVTVLARRPSRTSSDGLLADEVGVVAEQHRRERLQLTRDGDRHAVLGADRSVDLLGALLVLLRETLQDLGAACRIPGRPTGRVVEGPAGRGDRGVDVGRATPRAPTR